MYKIPLSFRRTITKLWQLPYIGGVIFVITLIWAIYNSIHAIPEQIYNWFTIPQVVYSGAFWISDMVLLCAAIFASFFFGSIIKYCYYKPRPEPQNYTNRWQKIDASSFPSVHTANSLILAFFGLMASGGLVIQNAPIRQQFVVQVVLPLFWILFYITISYSRVVLKKHFWIDLVGGTIFGALIVAWVIWQADMIIAIVWNVMHTILSWLTIL